MGKAGIIVTGLIAVVLAVGTYVVFKSDDKSDNANTTNTTSSTGPSSTTNSSAPEQSDKTKSSPTTITYSDNGFSPSTLTVKAGDTITLKNTSSSASVVFSSDPHPTHTLDPELNQSSLVPGQSLTFKVTKTGSHGYHNHEDPSQTGTIVVQ